MNQNSRKNRKDVTSLKYPRNISNDNNRLIGLWEKSKEGDKQAFCELADNQYRILFNYATSFTKDREFIKDTIQDLFLYLWEQKDKINIQYVTIYLIKALRNNLIQQLRKTEYLSDIQEVDDISEDYNIESDIIRSEFFVENEQKIKHAIGLLPKRQQEALFLKFYQGLDNEKIAELMEVNRQSVANLIYKSLCSLKLTLQNGTQLVLSLIILMKYTFFIF